jgi:hypothetical protein
MLVFRRCEALYVASGPLGPAKRARIIALAAEIPLPAIYSFRVFPVEEGFQVRPAPVPRGTTMLKVTSSR